jgi:hypothetical protein
LANRDTEWDVEKFWIQISRGSADVKLGLF